MSDEATLSTENSENALSSEDSLSAEDALSSEDTLSAEDTLSTEDSLRYEDSLSNENAETFLKLSERNPIIEEKMIDYMFGKKTITTRYELYDKSTYLERIAQQEKHIAETKKTIEKIKHWIDNFDSDNDCTEAYCRDHGNCRCKDSLIETNFSYKQDVKRAKENIQILQLLVAQAPATCGIADETDKTKIMVEY